MDIQNHCGQTRCPCTHTQGCERGWIWGEYKEVKSVKLPDGSSKDHIVKYDGVTPCPICDPDRAEIFATSKNSFELGERLRARSNHNRVKTYESEQESRTRTL